MLSVRRVVMSSKTVKATYGVIGLGRFGFPLALELAQSGAALLVIAKDAPTVHALRESTEPALLVPSLSPAPLLDSGVQNCDVVIVALGKEMALSILTTMNLISLGVKRVIAKAITNDHGTILAKLGAEVVFPERDMALRLAHRLEQSKLLDFIQLSEELNLSKLIIPQSLVGKSVIESNLRKRFGINIIAIKHQDELIDMIDPSYVFSFSDILFVVGKKEGLERFSALN